MSLTTGRGPLSARPAGRFSPPIPGPVVYVEPFPRRLRGITKGQEVVASERAVLVHRPGRPPTYAFPADDVHGIAAEAEPEAPGHVRVAWDAVEAWYEEEEPVLGHPRNPYHRIDCLRSRRRLRVEVSGEVLVDADETTVLFETSLAPVLYVEPGRVRADVLVPSPTTTICPYKGIASWWTAVTADGRVDDVAWSYEDPVPEALPIRGMLSFDGARTTIHADLPDES